MSFLDTILGALNSGNAAPPISADDDRFMGAPPSGLVTQNAAMPMPPAFPGGVPLPMPRPAEAPQLAPPPLMQPGEESGMGGDDSGGLLGAVAGNGSGTGDKLAQVLAALGGGLSKVQNSPFKGQAFAQPMGGALLAGNQEENLQFKQRLDALDRALKLKGIEQLGAYRDDLSDARVRGLGIQQQRADQQGDYNADRTAIGLQNADTRSSVAPSTIRRNEAAAGYNDARTAGATTGGPAPQRLTAADAASDRWYLPRSKALDAEALRIQNAPAGTMSTDERKAAMADVKRRRDMLDGGYKDLKERNRVARGLNPDGSEPEPVDKPTPARPSQRSAAPTKAETEISMEGNGTQGTPYRPMSQDDYDQIESGSFYTAADGSVRRKR